MMEKKYLAWRAYRYRAEEVEKAAESLKDFLTRCKTEREAVRELEERFRNRGFRSIEECDHLSPGDGVFMNWRGRAFAAFRAGVRPVEKGFLLIGAHADSPRIDIKCKPLYEDGNLLMADAHYYGGIKKYQWTNIPLALHGEIYTKDGKCQYVSLGEKGDEPVFLIPDLAPHLDSEIAERKADKTIEGENLDAIFGHRPDFIHDESKDAGTRKNILKATIVSWMKSRWGIDERELVSAELSLVPAGDARDAGLDCGLVASYGIDDRVCVWAAAEALLTAPAGARRGMMFIASDREETGSHGATGSQGRWLEHFVLELLALAGGDNPALGMRRAYAASEALSADVTEAYNPLYKDSFDPRQMPFSGNGIALMRYSGSRGKYGTNEARGEFVARVTSALAGKNIPWQVGSLGKVDGGGGGTISMDLAALGMDALDFGPPVLSLHSPWEMISKADLLSTLEAYGAFYAS